jgi:hypothetical protein
LRIPDSHLAMANGTAVQYLSDIQRENFEHPGRWR